MWNGLAECYFCHEMKEPERLSDVSVVVGGERVNKPSCRVCIVNGTARSVTDRQWEAYERRRGAMKRPGVPWYRGC